MMDRVELRTDPPPAQDNVCWHCGTPVGGSKVARYLYPGDRPRTAIIEDWHRCRCGAYQNVRRPSEISISSLNR